MKKINTPLLPVEEDLSIKPMLIIDLFSGSYVKSKTGHECFNLDIANDDKFYGYCPPDGNIDISRLGAKRKDDYIDNVLVVYTRKVGDGCADRAIIAFIDNATVYRHKQKLGKEKRNKRIKGSTAGYEYNVVSDNLYNLESAPNKYVIRTQEYNKYLFRGQRVFKGKNEVMDKGIINYIRDCLNTVKEDDFFDYQRSVHLGKASSNTRLSNACNEEPQYSMVGGSKVVAKKISISKSALARANYQCAFEPSHTTFLTSQNVQYMEGHHLIPCTLSNASKIWERYKKSIDCEENIVCLCPTCHRRVHFGSKEEKETILRKLWESRVAVLRDIGLDISFEELLSLYSRG